MRQNERENKTEAHEERSESKTKMKKNMYVGVIYGHCTTGSVLTRVQIIKIPNYNVSQILQPLNVKIKLTSSLQCNLLGWEINKW